MVHGAILSIEWDADNGELRVKISVGYHKTHLCQLSQDTSISYHKTPVSSGMLLRVYLVVSAQQLICGAWRAIDAGQFSSVADSGELGAFSLLGWYKRDWVLLPAGSIHSLFTGKQPVLCAASLCCYSEPLLLPRACAVTVSPCCYREPVLLP
uniref:Uncharacterized protein n=1 Tax=Timema tahoe TaxID=61484 RepID=A0A7R9ICQ1_9NEOP|nr:unnamed protein product [Timema tahoe]